MNKTRKMKDSLELLGGGALALSVAHAGMWLLGLWPY
jgi:hypothetical protein